MDIILNRLGKRYNKQWIFRNLSIELKQGSRYAILGANGSGKSTLLQTIAGYRLPSEGNLEVQISGKAIPSSQLFEHISIASPYLELIEDFNIEELLKFHFSLKHLITGMTMESFTDKLQMQHIKNKSIRQYSSGMKQRLRLALAFFTASHAVLLDEPCSNLDASGIEWYKDLLRSFSDNRLLIICSNHQQNEYAPCDHIIEMGMFKTQ
jgi:ABC-type multidrug transport system ATPase subunit